MPFAPVTEAGWLNLVACCPVVPDMFQELINYVMPSGVQDMIIPFAVAKISPVILLSGPMILNSVDAAPLSGLSFTVMNLSTSLMAIQLNAILPEGAVVGSGLSNYVFRGLVMVVC